MVSTWLEVVEIDTTLLSLAKALVLPVALKRGELEKLLEPELLLDASEEKLVDTDPLVLMVDEPVNADVAVPVAVLPREREVDALSDAPLVAVLLAVSEERKDAEGVEVGGADTEAPELAVIVSELEAQYVVVDEPEGRELTDGDRELEHVKEEEAQNVLDAVADREAPEETLVLGELELEAVLEGEAVFERLRLSTEETEVLLLALLEAAELGEGASVLNPVAIADSVEAREPVGEVD
jgi:hypothetical protein